MKIAELPFHERPVHELLNLTGDRSTPDLQYAGFGWALVDKIWCVGTASSYSVRNALVVAIHTADDAEPIAHDIELEFEISDQESVSVLASAFLERWLPRLPRASAIVLCLCNPHRATIVRPAGATAPVHYALGNVASWLDHDDGGERIELVADTWSTLRVPVSTELERRPNTAINDEQKQTFIALWLLKKLDLKPEDGGITFPVVLDGELAPLDEPLQQLAVDDLIQINVKKARYELTKKGIAHLGEVIDEASDLVDELDDLEMDEAIEEIEERGLDVYRARFLWGWFEGEFDDLVLFQERRGVSPVERMWAFYLTGDDFWREIAKELEDDEDDDD